MTEGILMDALRKLSKEQIQSYCNLLPEKQKLILSLVVSEWIDFNEVSRMLDIPKDEIRQLFMESVKRLCIRSVG